MSKTLIINPGSTSTKIAVYNDENILIQENVLHSADSLKKFSRIGDQFELRKNEIEKLLKEKGFNISDFEAIVARGGVLKPLEAGTYRVNEAMLQDLREAKIAEHASNLGALIADSLAKPYDISTFIADPVSVDEFEPLARISGLKEITRKSLLHALNIRATAYKAALEVKEDLKNINLIIAHLGGGISIAPMKKGKIIDVNNANEGGPFSPERAGGLPSISVLEMSFSGISLDEVTAKLTREGGIVSYLKTNSAKEVALRIKSGDKEAELIYKAMAYQIAKEIGAQATVLKGEVDYIVLTGGIAFDELLTGWIKERVIFIAPVLIIPGENELEALNSAYLRVKNGIEKEKVYV